MSTHGGVSTSGGMQPDWPASSMGTTVRISPPDFTMALITAAAPCEWPTAPILPSSLPWNGLDGSLLRSTIHLAAARTPSPWAVTKAPWEATTTNPQDARWPRKYP